MSVMDVLLAVMAAATDPEPEWWQAFLSPLGLDRLLQAGGLVLLATLFATNRILTKGQHESRIADLVKFHDAQIVQLNETHGRERDEKDRHHTEVTKELTTSRDAWKAVADRQTVRADLATEQLGEQNEVTRLALAQVDAIHRVATGTDRTPSVDPQGVTT